MLPSSFTMPSAANFPGDSQGNMRPALTQPLTLEFDEYIATLSFDADTEAAFDDDTSLTFD